MGNMMLPSKIHKGAGKLTHLLTPNKSILMGTWNIRNTFQAGKAATIANKMVRSNLLVLGLVEPRWTVIC